MKPNVYISCPMTVSQTVLDRAILCVELLHAVALYWHKGSRYLEDHFKNLITKCDAFVLILPEVAWSCPTAQMTSGSRKELDIAIKAKRPIFLAYIPKQGDMKIYSAKVQGDEVRGIASTAFNLQSILDKSRDKEEPAYTVGYDPYKSNIEGTVTVFKGLNNILALDTTIEVGNYDKRLLL